MLTIQFRSGFSETLDPTARVLLLLDDDSRTWIVARDLTLGMLVSGRGKVVAVEDA